MTFQTLKSRNLKLNINEEPKIFLKILLKKNLIFQI